MKDLFERLTDEDYQRMSTSEFLDLVEEHNKYVREKYSRLNENHKGDIPHFDSIEDFMAYYDAEPLRCHK